jgi:hypothetical protein
MMQPQMKSAFAYKICRSAKPRHSKAHFIQNEQHQNPHLSFKFKPKLQKICQYTVLLLQVQGVGHESETSLALSPELDHGFQTLILFFLKFTGLLKQRKWILSQYLQ